MCLYNKQQILCLETGTGWIFEPGFFSTKYFFTILSPDGEGYLPLSPLACLFGSLKRLDCTESPFNDQVCVLCKILTAGWQFH